ncbi:transcriptional regulator [Sphaerochaeta pleomorpha str. Grapes]|uniref:Transcriptional regulator n=1 Tax=Sphaerochaeta pleomorpha (strain ATCC BAA-1885 / DSM 22778 / Grapes) TaxID=158190 RepID=G8QR52_SPHPG|nr:LysR family transcriptional regulator [Sphaerochaeta pleomorpha]AEV30987.1 transcriptional regulator [Sphaerochaeta pleomorpha str. Grapes]
MTIRDVRIFCEVVETLSMSKAAENLDCAQPTVSHVIAGIEADYGVRLFERFSKRLYLTEDGQYLYSHARDLLCVYDEIDTNLGAYSHPVLVRIGATITVGSSVMPALCCTFEKEHTNLNLKVVVDNTKTIEQLLLENKLDLALVEGTVSNTDLVTDPVVSDELVLVMSPDFPFSFQNSCRAEDLAGLPFIFREEGSGTRQRFIEFLSAHKTNVQEKWVCHSSDVILNAVKSGLGLTVISSRLVSKDLQMGKLRKIQLADANFVRAFSLVYHKDKFFTPQLEALVKKIKTLE